MTIHLYLNNQEETIITSFYDMSSNPFSLGDIIGLSVEDLFPVQYSKFKEDTIKNMLQDNKKNRKLFNRKKIKLVKEGKWIDYNIITEPKLTIEYHCELIEL